MKSADRMALGISAVFLLTVAAPFVYAHYAADGQHVFGGFLLNPIDGNSYLAKMRQGYEGAWLFKLPYTAQPGDGAAINLYYLFLGHAARWFGLGLIFTLHAARLLGAAAMCAALWKLLGRALPETRRVWAFALALFGSGLGWLAVAFGGFTSDFWVAEAYPFLAAVANAHFPMGLALQIYLVTPDARQQPAFRLLAAFVLSVIYPFGWAVAVATLAANAVVARALSSEAAPTMHQATWALLGGLPYAVYALWIANAHPVLAQWNVQNLTPAPLAWDLALALSPALGLAAFGAYQAVRQRQANLYVLVAWAATCIGLVYFPLGLQRRLISGLFIPLAALAVVGLTGLVRTRGRLRIAIAAVLLLSLPTNLLILLGGMQAARSQEPALYLSTDETAAYDWLDEQAASETLVLAPEAYGLRLPAYTSQRVWYGHPFETVQAEQHRAELEAFFDERAGRSQLAAESGAAFILQAEGDFFSLTGWRVVFERSSVRVLARE